jgi:transcription elongation factor Elf1
MARVNRFDMSSFYCPSCGKKAMDLPRPRSLTRQAFHRKKLYCPWCRETYNCIEVRNEIERQDFIADWEDGVYETEVQAVVE